MKKFFYPWLETLSIGGLMLGSVLASIASLLILLYVFFDFKPYYSSGSFSLGLTDFKNGIPVAVDIYYPILDTNILEERYRAASFESRGSTLGVNRTAAFRDSLVAHNAVYRDSIFTLYLPWHYYASDTFSVKGARITKGVLNIETSNVKFKLDLVYQSVLSLIIAAYCMWQLAILLQNITKGFAFEQTNFKRLRNVGIVIVLLQLFFFFIRSYPYYGVTIGFYSTIPNFRSPVELSTQSESNFSASWLLIGAGILIISMAFKRGLTLQQEQQLTI